MAGWVVERGGDVDGDGIDDLLVGAPWEAVPGEAVDFPGAVYVVSSDMDSGDLGGATAVLLPDETNAGTGKSLAGGGDMNGDGYDDVVVGMFSSALPPKTQGGRVLVFLGPVSGVLPESAADLQVESTSHKAQLGYGLGRQVLSGMGPFRLTIGAPAAGEPRPGEVFMWDEVASGEVEDRTADHVLVGSEVDGAFGLAQIVVDVDLTGDGIHDVVVPEMERSALAEDAGTVHLFDGGESGADVRNASDVTNFESDRVDARAGMALLPHPDANGDGHPDLLVSAPLDPEVDTRGGKVWILHGPLTEGGLLDDMAAAAILPEGGYEWLGRSLASPRDLDGDGLSDLAIGVPRDFYFGADYPGKVYLFPSTLSGTVTGADAIGVLQGELPADYASGGMTGGFDADGDGLGDLAVGAPMVNGTGTASGRVYVVTDFP